MWVDCTSSSLSMSPFVSHVFLVHLRLCLLSYHLPCFGGMHKAMPCSHIYVCILTLLEPVADPGFNERGKGTKGGGYGRGAANVANMCDEQYTFGCHSQH